MHPGPTAQRVLMPAHRTHWIPGFCRSLRRRQQSWLHVFGTTVRRPSRRDEPRVRSHSAAKAGGDRGTGPLLIGALLLTLWQFSSGFLLDATGTDPPNSCRGGFKYWLLRGRVPVRQCQLIRGATRTVGCVACRVPVTVVTWQKQDPATTLRDPSFCLHTAARGANFGQVTFADACGCSIRC